MAGVRALHGQRMARARGCLAALSASVVIGACGSDGDGDSNASNPRGSRASGHLMKETIPAQIDEKPQSFVSSELLRPVVNAWRTSSRKRLTEVDAGALAADNSTGAFAIFRHEFATAGQDVNVVKVNDSGPLRITRAPLGRKVIESAEKSGKIDFAGARGVRGTLDLSDDTVRVRER
jgi:hypothetical protein